jgi:signal peptidase I
MMGDNHPYSCDSRTWGTVARSAIIGKAFVRIWPFARVGFL